MPRNTRKQLADPNEDRQQDRRDEALRDLQAEMHWRWRNGDDPVDEDATPTDSLLRQLRATEIQPRPRRRDQEMPERTTPCAVKGYTGRIPRQKPNTNRPKSRTERRSV